jgi:hypothetical protein
MPVTLLRTLERHYTYHAARVFRANRIPEPPRLPEPALPESPARVDVPPRQPDPAISEYLPPYSPDFNPIEQLFAKLKALLRKAAERSVEGLWNRIACLLDAFQPDECANYFRNSGYAAW